ILYAARRPPFIQVYAVTTVYILTTSSFTIPPHPPSSTLFPYTTLFRSLRHPSGGSHPSCSPLETARARESGRHLQGSSPPLRSRSEEHTSELQSRFDLVCRLLLEKKNQTSSIALPIVTMSSFTIVTAKRRRFLVASPLRGDYAHDAWHRRRRS